ncbi:MAG: DDE-type integrase/transposase/recombinase [Frankiaceae bacterium]
MIRSPKRDKKAARRFFTRALAGATSPTEVTTDQAPAYPRVVEDVTRRHLCPPTATRTCPSMRKCRCSFCWG